jgi:hypothetical protein
LLVGEEADEQPAAQFIGLCHEAVDGPMLLGGWPVWVAQAVGALTTIRETVSIRILPHGRRPPSKSNPATRELAPLYLDLLKLFLSAA